jgi:hypothetical protein
MVAWCSLFLPHPNRDAVVQVLKDSLQALGYTAFNPFGLMPGRTYPQAVRLFVAPENAGWVRALGEPDGAMLPLIAQYFPCLLVALNGAEARIEAYAAGAQQPLETGLAPYLKPGIDVGRLRDALSITASSVSVQQNDMDLLRDALPEDVKSMNVNTRQAQKMFDRLSVSLTQRSGNTGNEAAARELLRGERPDWNSAGGLKIRAIIDCLTIADGWQQPDFVTLRDAYQLHERRRQNPAAMLYPGDAEAMAAVPDALNYSVVYAGKG